MKPDPGLTVLWMEFWLGFVITAEDDAHIDPAQGISLQANAAHTEHGSNSFPVGHLSAAHQDVGAIREFRRIPEEDHIEAGASQLPSGDPCEPHPVGAVQDLNEPAGRAGGNRVGMPFDLIGPRPQPHRGGDHNEACEEPRDDQAESAAGYGKREFQKRTVGSGRIQPDWIT